MAEFKSSLDYRESPRAARAKQKQFQSEFKKKIIYNEAPIRPSLLNFYS